MSKINRIRILNLNYNGNTIRIDDETFHLNGESTLLSLRNGGGKTVLVQMVIALFVNNSYRNIGDREFKSYFTSSQPTFIIVEWCLDEKQGYFLTGMMVRKCQNVEENNKEELDICNFTGFYKEPCEYDLEHLPVVEEIKGKRMLKGFGACKKELEELKKKYREFSYYDMAQPYQRRMYFSKLKEYQINHKEWETIIKKVNGKESGLSELFANAKDEKGLVEKWILTAIEGKLNQENDRIQEFRTLAYKLIKSYRENETKLRRKEIIESYFQDAEVMDKQIAAYGEAEQALTKQKSQIAGFVLDIARALEELEQKLLNKKDKAKELAEKLKRIEQEEFSYRIYQYEDEKKELLRDRIDSEERIQRSVYIRQEAEKELCLFQCAKLYKEAADFEKEIFRLREQIEVLMSEQKDSEEERKKLGSRLYWFYYSHMKESEYVLKEQMEKIAECEKEQKENAKQIQKEIEKEKELSGKIGSVSFALKGFDRIEQKFNQKFSMEFARNIIGEYEDGILALYERKFQDELTELNTKVTRLTEQAFSLKKEEKRLHEEKETWKIRIMQGISDREFLEKRLERLKKEESRRRILMQHILAPEQELNQKALLLERIERKIAELELVRDEYRRNAEAAEKEYGNLKQGVVMELPEHIQAYFEEQNIEIVYGMSWLKKNGRDTKENQTFVEKNPFLPYCIIMTKAELEKLCCVADVYTNFPIPIVLREQLEDALDGQKSPLVSFGKISFFIMFNRHLLDPEELEQLLERKKTEIKEWLEKIEGKTEEIKQYGVYAAEIEQQEFTQKLMEEIEEKKKKKEEEQQEITKQEEECRQKIKELIKKQEETIKKAELAKERRGKAEQKKEEYAELLTAYESYLEDKRNQERYMQRLKEAEGSEKSYKEKQKELEELLVALRNEQHVLQRELKENRESVTEFLPYQGEKRESEKKEAEKATDADISGIRVRYRAITEGISASLKDLNENLAKERGRYDRKCAELNRKNKYQFPTEKYQDMIYSEEQELHLEENIEKADREENAAKEAHIQLEKDMTRVETKLEDLKRRLQEKTGSESLVDRKQIIDTDFAARRKLTEYEKEKREREIQDIFGQCNAFQNVQAAMAEYSDFKIVQERKEDEPGVSVMHMEKAELIEYSGILRRELKQKNKLWEQQQDITGKLIRQFSEKECYQEDFFKKGFENLLALVKNVVDIKLQLATLTASYDSSLKKLQVDLQSIGKERDNLEELFLEYVRDIDEHMRRIDKNSTIPVRGRGLKMLRLQVPEWENNKETYQKKLKDFMENFIQRGLEAVEENENVQELLGKLITTKRLYDEIVGIGAINIRLYKIEAEREVSISWKEVSANSGGEGFLSAFVILSCLLSYMRRDENDLFSGNGEGKVLIMDNPFAQTNAVHLLKPMIDMAKRTNTQLICLSGLGGDSIYNRFDNIYVLNLINSSLRNMRYLKGEHLKGEEVSMMVSSQFQVEQTELF